MTKEDLPKPILIEDLGMIFATESSRKKVRFGLYKCGFCGNEFRTQPYGINNGHSKSCGCYKSSKLSNRSKTHGLIETRLYRIWASIKDRTLNPKNKRYNDYGGRGITICEEWKNDFMSFYSWAMENGYEENKGLSIDRIDNDGNYEPNNCRWTTRIIQSRNRRIHKSNKSGYRGVCYNKGNNKYVAQITINNKSIHLGYFQTTVEGAIVYNNYIIENNLEGFILNEIPQEYTKKEITNEKISIK